FIDGTDAVGITVSRKSNQRACGNYAFLQDSKIAINRFRINSTKQRISMGTYRLNLQLPSAQEAFKPGSARTMHWIDDHCRLLFAQHIKIHIRLYLPAITSFSHFDSPGSVRCYFTSFRRIGVDQLLHLRGCFRCSASSPRRFDLEAIKLWRIM